MAGTIDNPRIWAAANCYVAPLGTAEPTDVSTTVDPAWVEIGLLGEDGFELDRESDVKEHYAYGSILVRTTQTRYKRSLTLAALEDNPAVFDLANPGSKATSAGGVTTREYHPPEANTRMFLLELRDGTYTKRIVIPRGEVTKVEKLEIKDDEMLAQTLTVQVYSDATGLLYKEITDDPATAGTTASVAVASVTAGSPGTFGPRNAAPPASLATLKADHVVGDTGTAKPTSTPWTSGQSVALADKTAAHWSGTAWVAGAAT